MNIMFVSGACGGKTTYANILVEHYNFKRISLADPIRELEAGVDGGDLTELVSRYFTPVNGEMLQILKEAKDIPREQPKPRRRLQFIGTEGGRKRIGPNIWINILKKRLSESLDTNWVLDDCRFVNEYEALKEDFITIKIIMDKETQLKRLLTLYPDFDPKALEHASEKEIELINPKLTISGTITTDEVKQYYDRLIYRSG